MDSLDYLIFTDALVPRDYYSYAYAFFGPRRLLSGFLLRLHLSCITLNSSHGPGLNLDRIRYLILARRSDVFLAQPIVL